MENMKKISTTKGFTALVDNEDYPILSRYKWYAHSNKRGHVYPRTWTGKGGQRMFMHAMILGEYKGIVDHINGNGLDNRKANLRIATYSENGANRRISKKNNTSGFKGVSWYKPHKKWRAGICFDGKCKHLGYFDSKEEAAEAYNKAAKGVFGRFALLNKI